MYQNPYHVYPVSYPYANYPSEPLYTPYHSTNKMPAFIQKSTVKHELKKAVSSPTVQEIEDKAEEVQAIETEEPSLKEVNTSTEHFLNYLGKRRGKTISVATQNAVINGTLEEIFPDCILVKAQEESYHIKPEGIVYFK
ncbi:DUF2642 domain-containing protein [Aneurinibacillus terranovensis]|uniref:DUF2642 domain-containing protein n=1 Tax=Aneurinibacillus terranovensis TaxID=278991 RepID=UPI0004828B72|nr:DUF2642 domain-containing protein [Aneurinibacillus terranovensis]